MVLVLGCGSIGRRHLRNLRFLRQEPVGYDPDASRRRWVEKELGCETLGDLRGAWERPWKAAWICSPPHLHAPLALEALRRKIPCFIEKPVAHRLADARAISNLARSRRTPVAVGYMLRQHPALKAVKAEIESGRLGRLLFLRAEGGQYLPDWRPWQDYRKSYTANRAMGGGILLDGSHEIDLARWLAGEVKSVYCSAGRLSGLAVDVEDTAALVLRFASGAMAEIHMDMVQRSGRRNLQVVFERGTLLWDMPSAELRAYSSGSGRWTAKRFAIDVNSLYVDEARAFLRRLRRPPGDAVVTADDGLRTLAVVAAAQRSARSRREERP